MVKIVEVDAGEVVKANMDSSLLFHQLSRDVSLDCLIRCSIFDYATLSSLNHSFRSLVKSGELYRLRKRENIVEHFVYYSHSPLKWEVFDPNGCRWRSLPEMPSTQCFISSDKESLAVGPELHVFGRDVMSKKVYKFNILTNTWSSGKTMNTSRCLFASASHNETAFIAGGCDDHGVILSSAELYDSKREKFDTLPSMNKARKACAGFFMDGKFYVVGGVYGQEKLTCGEEFDPMTKTWNLISDMIPSQVGGIGSVLMAPPLVAVVNNTLYVADYGGGVVKRYKKEQNSWVIVGALPEQVTTINGWGIAFRACKDNLIFICGVSGIMIGVYSCIPVEGVALQWNLLARKHSSKFIYNCSVMGC